MQQNLCLPRRQGVLTKASPGHAWAQWRCTCRPTASWTARTSTYCVRRKSIPYARFTMRIPAYEHLGESR